MVLQAIRFCMLLDINLRDKKQCRNEDFYGDYTMIDIKSMYIEELEQFIVSMGEKKFHAVQL